MVSIAISLLSLFVTALGVYPQLLELNKEAEVSIDLRTQSNANNHMYMFLPSASTTEIVLSASNYKMDLYNPKYWEASVRFCDSVKIIRTAESNSQGRWINESAKSKIYIYRSEQPPRSKFNNLPNSDKFGGFMITYGEKEMLPVEIPIAITTVSGDRSPRTSVLWYLNNAKFIGQEKWYLLMGKRLTNTPESIDNCYKQYRSDIEL